MTKTAARRAPPPRFAAAAFRCPPRCARVTHLRARTRDTRRIAWDPNARFEAAAGRDGAREEASRGGPTRRARHEKRRSWSGRGGCGGARAKGGARDATGGDRDGTATPSARGERRAVLPVPRARVRHRARAVRGEPPGHGDVRDRLRGAGVPDLRLREDATETGGAAAWRRGRPGHLRAGVPRRPHVRRDRLDDRRLQAHAQAVRVPSAEIGRRRRRRHRVAVRLRVGSDIARRERPRSGLGHLEGQARGAGRQDTQDTR